MQPETRDFPTAVVVSAYTGTLLCLFSDLHECAEFALGHPVWTHEMASPAHRADLRAALVAQHPALAAVNLDGVNVDNWVEYANRARAGFGDTLTLTKGVSVRAKSPIETAAEMVGADRVVAVTL